MRLTKKRLKKLILEEFDLLLEAEPEEDEAPEEETEDEAPEEETEDEAPEEETAEEIYVSPEEMATLSRSADDQIQAYLIDFETKAIKSAQIAGDDTLRVTPDTDIEVEWYKRPLDTVLFEEAESDAAAPESSWVGSPDIDVASYSADVSRLIDNHESLLDMEALIINKARDYLMDKYDQETADYFQELMDTKYDKHVDHRTREDEEEVTPPAPYALGALGADGGA